LTLSVKQDAIGGIIGFPIYAQVAQTAIEFPPMQKSASFSLEAVKAQIAKAIAAHQGN
jgi:hypothetical protein